MKIEFSTFDANGNGRIDKGAEAGNFVSVLKKNTKDSADKDRKQAYAEAENDIKEAIFYAVKSTDQSNNANGIIDGSEISALAVKLGTDRENVLEWVTRLLEIGDAPIEDMANQLIKSPEVKSLVEAVAVNKMRLNQDLNRVLYLAIMLGHYDISIAADTKIKGSDGEMLINVERDHADLYQQFNAADKNNDGKISFGSELLDFYRSFSTKKNNILSSDDMDRLTALTGVYFTNPYMMVKGRKTRAVDLANNTKVGRNDVIGFHRFTKLGEALVFGDLAKNYGSTDIINPAVGNEGEPQFKA